VLNLIPATTGWHWDPYPFIPLNLAFSTQAAYAALLILLTKKRQTERDRAQNEQDRANMSRVMADAEYLAREVPALRLAQGELVRRDYLDRRLAEQTDRLESLLHDYLQPRDLKLGL
jgi:uncharacterized membrane protein